MTNDVIDPDAFRRSLETVGEKTRVSFRFGPYSETAASDGEICLVRWRCSSRSTWIHTARSNHRA